MARCEDFPCCGHELGCCPDFDESGKQLNMKCVCGATLPIDNPSSCCDRCLRQGEDFEDGDCERGEYIYGECDECGAPLDKDGNCVDCEKGTGDPDDELFDQEKLIDEAIDSDPGENAEPQPIYKDGKFVGYR